MKCCFYFAFFVSLSLVLRSNHEESNGGVFNTGDTAVNGEYGIKVGYFGKGYLNILSGATLNSAGWVSLGYMDGGEGIVTVDGNGSLWTLTGSMYVGSNATGTGSLNISNSGKVSTDGTMFIGYHNTGTLDITSGGQLTSNNGYVGYQSGSVSHATVDGAGSLWINKGSLSVAETGNGVLDISNGGKVTTKELYLGSSVGASGTINLTNGGILDVTDGNLVSFVIMIGYAGEGSLNVLSGSTLNTAGLVHLGFGSAGKGTITVDGNGSTWNSTGSIRIGSQIAGATGELNISNGGVVDANGNTVFVGLNSANGTLNITSGGKLISSTGDVGYSPDCGGIALIDGAGSTWTNNGTLYMTQYGGTGVMTVSNGGLVETQRIAAGPGTASMNFNGGTIKALASSADFIAGTYNSLNLQQNGLTMQVDSGFSVGVNQVFSGVGGMNKTGGGTFALNGSQAYTGLTDVKSGKFTGDASFAGSLTVRNGAAFSPGNGAWTANIAGNYTQESGAMLIMDIGSGGSDMLVVGGDVNLNGILSLILHGSADADYYVLIDNRGSDPISGFFSSILWNDSLIALTPMDGTFGGGSFVIGDFTYTLSYAGDASTGSLFGGRDVVLGVSPTVPEPASLSVLALGGLMLLRRRSALK